MSVYTFNNSENTLGIGTMYCIGRNYAAHAIEMGAQVPAERPLIFIKPPSAYTSHKGTVAIPSFSTNMHHEVELVVIIGKDGDNISVERASEYIAGYAIGVDLTLRDIQTIAKQKGEPWSIAKSFRGSAPLSSVIQPNEIDTRNADLRLYVNGELKQQGNTSAMERTVEQLISIVSDIFGLRKGDCIFTGTPEGVAQIPSGATVRAELNSTCVVEFTVE